MLLPLLLYALAALGYLCSEDKGEATFKLTKKLAFVFVPVIISSVRISSRLFQRVLIFSFVAATLLSAVYNELRAVLRFFASHDSSVFLYADFSYFLHPTYYAFVLSVALTWFLTALVLNRHETNFPNWIAWSGAAFLSLNILQASSRAGILGLAVVWFVVAYVTFQTRSRRVGLCIGLAALLAGTVITSFVFSNTLRLKAMTKAADVATVSPNDTESSQTRLLIWREALKLIKAKPVAGYGTGDVNTVLNERYEEAGMKYARSLQLNAHNQYIQEALSNGLVGTLVLMIWMLCGVVLTWKKHNWTGVVFFMLAGFNMMFECMLERREGIFTIVALASLFIGQALIPNHENTNSPRRNSTRSDAPFS